MDIIIFISSFFQVELLLLQSNGRRFNVLRDDDGTAYCIMSKYCLQTRL